MPSLFTLRKPYLLLGVVALIGWVYFVFRSEYFELKDVDIQASGGIISSADVLPLVFQILDQQPARPWSQRQRFFIPKAALEEGIKAVLYAEDVKAGDTVDNILRLKISFGSRYIYTTQNGEEFLKCAIARPAGIIVTDQPVLNAARQRYLSTDFTTQSLDGLVYVRNTSGTMDVPTMKQLLELGRVLDDHRIKFAHIEEQTSSTVAVQLDRGHEVLFDLSQPLKEQVQRCQAILRDKEYQKAQPSVIDLRIPGRAYLW
jgi:hypothetical protein